MSMSAKRGDVASRVLVAHAFGLCVTSIVVTFRTTSGFSFAGAAFSLFIGGLLSIPWMIVLAALIWFRGEMIAKHSILFAVFGPALVSGSWVLLTGGFSSEVAISSVASSLLYLMLVLCGYLLNANRRKGCR